VDGNFFVSIEAVQSTQKGQYGIFFPGRLFGKKSLFKDQKGEWTPETTVSIYTRMRCVQ
jgi:hypothetical protein